VSWDQYRLAKLTDGESASRLSRFEAELNDLAKYKKSKKDIEIINQLKNYESSVMS
jgi:hypothetical protein